MKREPPDARDARSLTELHVAVEKGNLELTKALLAVGADPNAVDGGSQTPLWSAAFDCELEPSDPVRLELMQALIAGGADPNLSTGWEGTLLHEAARDEAVRDDATEILGLVIAVGADLNARTEHGETPLHLAAGWGHSDAVPVLIAAGADLSARTVSGETPLHHAAEHGTPETVRALIAAGADPNCRTPYGDTPLHSWAGSDFVSVESSVCVLLDAGANAAALNAEGATPWDLLEKNPSLHKVEGSVAYRRLNDARLLARDEAVWTPLHDAALEGDLEAVRTLLAAGADPNAQCAGDDIGTPLHCAAGSGGTDAVRALLAGGADPNAYGVGDFAATPLHAAVEEGDPESVEALAAVCSDLNTRDSVGQTPLHRAATDNPEAVRLLIAAGADPAAQDGWCQTPLHRAARSGSLESVQALITVSADPNAKAQDEEDLADFDETPLHLAAAYGHLEVVRALLAAGADPNVESGTGHTPLHSAVGKVEMMEALLAAGADPIRAASDSKLLHYIDQVGAETAQSVSRWDLVDRCELASWLEDVPTAWSEWTPLHVAAGYGCAESVQALLGAGADVSARSEFGATPLHVGVVFGASELGRARTVAGADGKERGESGAVLRAFARYLELLTVLLAAGADPSARTMTPERTPLRPCTSRTYPLGGIFGWSVTLGGISELVKGLLAAGTEANAPTESGTTPLHLAVAGLRPKAYAVQSRRAVLLGGHRRYTPLRFPVLDGVSELVKVLVAAGAGVNARTELGTTPLHVAAERGTADAVKALIAAGADPNARHLGGDTSLHAWARSDFGLILEPGLVGPLLDAGADATARNAEGETPWDVLQKNAALDKLKGSDDYWRLNDARFGSP